MQRVDGQFVYAASDLNKFLECKRLTELDALAVRKRLEWPDAEEDEQAELIRRKGEEHEQRYLALLRDRHAGDVVEFGRTEQGIASFRAADRQTLEAMQRGPKIIYQATFFDGQFLGHADFLRRVERPSKLGDYSYEVMDTKLALNAKPYFLVQICNYSEHLERLQGCMPEYGYIVLGSGEERHYRLSDYLAYYRNLKRSFLTFEADPAFDSANEAKQYPYECKHCRICPWDGICKQKRIDDDHLSLVAWMRRDQLDKLETAGIVRVTELAQAPDERRPAGMTSETFGKLRRQASLQVRGRTSDEPIHELLAHKPPIGFAQLPRPAAGDVFFDMEGDPLFEPGRGLEYLFGCWMPDEPEPFCAYWGLDRDQERGAFQALIDFITERRKRYPAMHVYHYAPYEKVALRKLAQLHCTREDALDDLLRAEVFVDLYAVVRQTLVISEDSYGIKKLERFYGLDRKTEVKKGDESIVMFERWLQSRDQRILEDIKAYNRDDCRSTHLLREWLLARRDDAIAQFGIDFPFRPVKSPNDPCHEEFTEGCKKCVKRRNEEAEAARQTALESNMLEHILPPQTHEEYALMHPRKRERYLMGNILAYHRREEKPAWWTYFDRCENVDALIEFDKDAIGGLELCEDVEPEKLKKSVVYTYRFPDQTHKMKPGKAEDPRTRRAVTILSVTEDVENRLTIKTTATLDAARAITELTPPRPPSTGPQRKALGRIGQALSEGTLARKYAASSDLLANTAPRVTNGAATLQPDVVSAPAVTAVVEALDRSYLFIQGPPGSGKSTIGSQVICDLLGSGKRVAVTSTSHNAIHTLLHKVEACATENKLQFSGLYKHSDSDESEYKSRVPGNFIRSTDDNAEFDGGSYGLAGGTAWLLTREELDGAFDYLFIDEAGQVALADALALSTCAKNIVLLGDPSQLAQVSQGRQPLHVGDSVLQHLLGEDQTVAPHRGIFLDVSYRMEPEICAFVSGAMYEQRLKPAPQTAMHAIRLPANELQGLFYAPLEHAGNSSSSPEEADEVVRTILLLRQYGEVVDSLPRENAGVARPLTDRDVIVVTPYNAQRRLIRQRLLNAGLDVRVGTVDKFQGEEAPVVFYSLATSSGDDIPRNVGFLFERNRFNVAISRARAMSVLVCSPRLLDISCRTTEEMALANLLCAFAERAQSDLGDALKRDRDRTVAP